MEQIHNYFDNDSTLRPNYLLMSQELMTSRSLFNYPDIILANVDRLEDYQDKIKEKFDLQGNL